MILMSLNGIKLVVTRLASPARIGLQRLFLAGICEELEYRSPVILSRGFVHLAPDNQKHSLSITRNARRRSKFTCAEEASYHHFLRLTAFTPDVHMLSFLAQDFFFARLYIVLTVITVIAAFVCSFRQSVIACQLLDRLASVISPNASSNTV